MSLNQQIRELQRRFREIELLSMRARKEVAPIESLRVDDGDGDFEIRFDGDDGPTAVYDGELYEVRLHAHWNDSCPIASVATDDVAAVVAFVLEHVKRNRCR